MTIIPLYRVIVFFLLFVQDASRLIKVARQRAASYLSRESGNIQDDDVFKMAITAYALSLSSEKSVQIFDRLWKLVKGGE